MSDSIRDMYITVRRIMLWAALFGLFVATYLLITYVTGGPIACGIVHGCDVVRASSWASLFRIPLPVFGVLFYGAVVALLVLRTLRPHWRARLLYRLSMVLVTIGFIESAFLTLVEWLDLKAFCLWCLFSAAAATVLFLVAWWDRSHPLEDAQSFRELRFQFFSFTAAVIVGVVALFVLIGPRTDGDQPKLTEATRSAEETRQIYEKILPVGTTVEGPATSSVVLVEFIDFQCPTCRLAQPEIQKVRDTFHGRIRFAYRHFPLSIHPHAAGAALAAVCADAQGHLFDYGDLMLANQNALTPQDLVRYAEKLKLDVTTFKACLLDEKSQARVTADIVDGKKLGVNSTPTFFLNDVQIDGLPSAEQLEELIGSML